MAIRITTFGSSILPGASYFERELETDSTTAKRIAAAVIRYFGQELSRPTLSVGSTIEQTREAAEAHRALLANVAGRLKGLGLEHAEVDAEPRQLFRRKQAPVEYDTANPMGLVLGIRLRAPQEGVITDPDDLPF